MVMRPQAPLYFEQCVHARHSRRGDIRCATCEYRRRSHSDVREEGAPSRGHSNRKGREAGRIPQVCLREGRPLKLESVCAQKGGHGESLLERQTDTRIHSRPLMARTW